MNDNEIANERTEVSTKNRFIILLMFITYIAMLTQFVPLWDSRDSDAASVFVLAAIFFNAALLSGIDHKHVLKWSFWTSGIVYLSVVIIAAFLDRRFRGEGFIGFSVISILFCIKYFVVVKPRLKKLEQSSKDS